jgi:tetratricopeptide (TPR) repeat protein
VSARARLVRPSIGGVCVMTVAAAVSGGEPAHRPFSRAEYVELVRRYARGERAEAVAALGVWSERDLARQLAPAEEAAKAAERCPSCPNSLEAVPLKAAVMLHWDLDRAEQPAPQGVEQPRRCPGPLATLAGRYARVIARSAPQDAFPKRFFHMVVMSCQWDGCFEEADRWASDALAVYPRDTELLVARGSVREESATLGRDSSVDSALDRGRAGPEAAAAAFRKEGLGRARRDFEDALRIEPKHTLARLRLGRVLWRLGQIDLAREQLQAALASATVGTQSYLAHLFLGRVRQDAGSLDEAVAEYRLAVELHPSALAAGVALSSALALQGDAGAARLALAQGMRGAGRRPLRDPYWDYLVVNAAELRDRLEDLYREALE